MPPIKRSQKPAAAPVRRRVAGHPGTTRPRTDAQVEDQGADHGAIEFGKEPRKRSWTRRPAGTPLAIAAVVVGLAAAGAGAYLSTNPGVEVQNQAFVDQGATDEVLTAAGAAVQRLVSIDHEKLDEYHASLGEFLTPNLVRELDENWPALKDSYEQSETEVDAQVREVGLTHLSGDSAEVLLVQDVSMTREGAAAGSTSGTYLVGLDRVDGVWKLSRIPDLPS